MKKSWVLLVALVLVTLIAVTPVLAGNGNQNGGQGQQSQNQEQNQEQEQTQGGSQNQEENQEQEQNQGGSQGQEKNQNQEKNGQQHGAGRQPDPLPGTQLFTLTGTITTVDASAITVLVHNGNRFVKPYLGQELVVLVTENTSYWQWTPDGYIPIGLGDIQVGDTTSMRGLVSDGAFTATRVTIDVPCCIP